MYAIRSYYAEEGFPACRSCCNREDDNPNRGTCVFLMHVFLFFGCNGTIMIGEIIAIGDELTSGRIINSTSGLAARELFLLGHGIRAMHTVGDAPELIGEALKGAIARSDFVLVTGGLGATTDDLTNEAVAKALNLKMVTNPSYNFV